MSDIYVGWLSLTQISVCVCRLNLVDGIMLAYRSINQFVSHICVSVEFDSEGVEFGRQGIGVEYYLCETYL